MSPYDFAAGDSAPATIVGAGRGPEPCRHILTSDSGVGPVIPRVQHRLERLLLEFQVLKQVGRESAEGDHQGLPGGLVVEVTGELLDLVQES